MSNKVKFGFKKVYYAPITEDANGVETYATPVELPGAVSMSLSPAGDMTEFYADDHNFFSDDNNNGYDGTLELALVPDDFKIACLGMVKDSNGIIIETATAVNTPFALLCEFTTDDKARRFVFYRCMATRFDVGANTKGESIEVQTETLNLKIRPDSNAHVKGETSEEAQPTVYNNWYSSVYTSVVSG